MAQNTGRQRTSPAPTAAGGIPDVKPYNPDRAIAEVMNQARKLNENLDFGLISRAYNFAAQRLATKKRESGEPYISHPIEVTRILVDLRLDTQTLAAGLLHDVCEDSHTPVEEVAVYFGHDIGVIVDGMTKISKMKLYNREQQQVDSFRKMLLACAKDVRVLLVKFADRLHNMRTLQYLSPERQVRIARETLDVYAPLAHRFGMGRLRRELEDLAFRYDAPEAYETLRHVVERKEEELRSFIDAFCSRVEDGLRESRNIESNVSGRLKHLYSIYRKMEAQGKQVDEIYDLLAVRVIVDERNQCYDALSYLHEHFTPLEGRFKDYIGMPKANGYQSLHTTVVNDDGRIIEVQIRTHKMHQVAEEGIARHWLYKEGRATTDIDQQTLWIRQFLEWSEGVNDPQAFVEQLKIDLFPDQIFVLTPKGDVVPLPRGATALDFAFAVHSEVGMHASVAQVDGRTVPLDHELHTSDSVKIVTLTTQRPSRDWLGMVKTSKAHTRIRHWLRQEEFEFNRTLGRTMLDKRLKKSGFAPTDDEWNEAAQAFNLKDREHLYAAVGGSEIAAGRVLDFFRSLVSPEAIFEANANAGFEALHKRLRKDRIALTDQDWDDLVRTFEQADRDHLCAAIGAGDVPLDRVLDHLYTQGTSGVFPLDEGREAPRESKGGIALSGVDSPMVRFAKCCQPVPGDPVFGFITRGRGITVHHRRCPNAESLRQEPDRIVPVHWEVRDETTESGPFKTAITIKGSDRVGLLSDLTGSVSESGVNIHHAEIRTEGANAHAGFIVEVRNLTQLRRLIAQLRSIPGIFDVARVADTEDDDTEELRARLTGRPLALDDEEEEEE